MSCSSLLPSVERFSRRRWVMGAGALAVAGLTSLTQANTSRQPLSVRGYTLQPCGEGQMRFFGLSVYTARLWVSDGFDPARHAAVPLALELAYARNFTGRDIAQRSLQEMKRQMSIDQALEAKWTSNLAAVLPDVKPGDRLLGVHQPQTGALFLQGERVLGTVDDPLFSELFFGIWLSAATSEPALRAALVAKA